MPTPNSVPQGSIKKRQGKGRATCAKGQRSFPTLKAALNHERTAHDNEHSTLKDSHDIDAIRVSENHLPTVDETPCWGQIGQPRLTSEGLRQWEMHAHVDHVFDMVPFWQRGIDAAEKGEVLRLEEFLDKMEGDGGWRTVNEVLGMLGGWKASTRNDDEPMWGRSQNDWQRGAWDSYAFGWAASERGAASTRIASDATESSHGKGSGWVVQEKWAKGGDLKVGRDKEGCRARVNPVRAVKRSGGREELHHFVDVIAQQKAVNEERRKQMHLFFEMPTEQKIKKIEETIRFLHTHA